MADEESDKEDRSQDASPRRLQQAFDEGQIPLGRDVVTLASWAGAVGALVFFASHLRSLLVNAVAATVGAAAEAPFRSLPSLLAAPTLCVLAVAALAGLAASLATVSQTRGGFWPHLAAPDLTRLFQMSRITRWATREFFIDLLFAMVKVAAVVAVAWSSLKGEVERLPHLLFIKDPLPLEALYQPMAHAGLNVLLLLALLAGGELLITRFRFAEKHKMTKQEAKREHREDEGDGMIKSRRKRRHRELSKAHAKQEVPKADALLVNPTHIAIAIRYRKDESAAPRVLAKGKGQLAEVMREIARENGIPIIQDIPLARLLYKKVRVGRQVPADTYKAVAAVLAVVYRLVGRR